MLSQEKYIAHQNVVTPTYLTFLFCFIEKVAQCCSLDSTGTGLGILYFNVSYVCDFLPFKQDASVYIVKQDVLNYEVMSVVFEQLLNVSA